jgi:hypothetical protein
MMFEFSIGGYGFEWNYGHTVNVFLYGVNTDAFSLDYGRDDLSEGDAMIAALEWIKYLEAANV